MRKRLLAAMALGLAPAVPAPAHEGRLVAGALVDVEVEVDGRTTPLYPAPDGSGRLYLEAREGGRYTVALSNRTAERLGVELTVDGLNVISGSRDDRRPGRMYVLGPGERTEVQGWRTSLREVRRFTFVDEARSYAARTGQANPKVGWIEVAAYREHRPHVRFEGPMPPSLDRDAAGASSAEAASPRAQASGEKSEGRADAPAPRGYPGTGWGARTEDHAVLVDFRPQPQPSDRVTLRYEYKSGLRTLGIDVRPARWSRDRLRERDRAEGGFARPPRW
jgi:hypothetical protein